MAYFAAILQQLPSIDQIESLEICDTAGTRTTLHNQPGQSGSVAVYNALRQQFGSINRTAAIQGLELYAEHTIDARAHPGKHPNIDRLLHLIEDGGEYKVDVVVRQN